MNDVSINLQVGDLKNKCIIDHWNNHKFLVVDISGNTNQCLQYALNALYHDVIEIKKSTILWSDVHYGQYPLYCSNDNAFVFNRMIDYNTSLFDDLDKKK